MFRATEGRWGSREAEITRVTFIGEDGAAGHVFQAGERDRRFSSASARVSGSTDFVFGIGIFNADGVCCYGTNTDIAELEAGRAARATGRSISSSRTSIWSKAPTSSTWPSTGATAIRTTTTACSIRSA